MMRTTVLRLCGQAAAGPSGVAAQSWAGCARPSRRRRRRNPARARRYRCSEDQGSFKLSASGGGVPFRRRSRRIADGHGQTSAAAGSAEQFVAPAVGGEIEERVSVADQAGVPDGPPVEGPRPAERLGRGRRAGPLQDPAELVGSLVDRGDPRADLVPALAETVVELDGGAGVDPLLAKLLPAGTAELGAELADQRRLVEA